uniref:Uncharacterized protein n=1 Tax=Panagrolaimus sp. ES5 TaxID=591445 RepID=A0AC34F2E8_9BILA
MAVKIITENPFNGISHSIGYRSTCAVTGNGTTETNFGIPFSDNKNIDNQCGIKFDKVIGVYWVEVVVHKDLIDGNEYERIFNVSCDINKSMTYQPKFDYFLELYPFLPIDKQETPENNGKIYILDAFMASFDDFERYRNLFKMTNCFVESENGSAVEIIDSNGCSKNPKFVTNVAYKNEWASFNLSSVNQYMKISKASKNDSSDTDSEDDYWYYESYKTTKTQGRPVKVINLSKIYENPYVTMQNFVPKVPEHRSSFSCVEENPVYVCQKMPQNTYI